MPSSISTVRPGTLPSSSTFRLPRRSVMRAVVDHGDARRRHALADAAGERGGALAVEVALQAVADRLVQQDAGPAGAQHDRHRARGRLARRPSSMIAMRAASRAKYSGGFSSKNSRPEASAAAGAALAPHAVLGRDHRHADREERLHVLHQHAHASSRCARASSRRPARRSPCRCAGRRRAPPVRALDEGDARRQVEDADRLGRVAPVERGRRRRPAAGASSSRTRCAPRCRAACAMAAERQVVGVRVARALAAHHAHAQAAGDARGGGADDALLEQERRRCAGARSRGRRSCRPRERARDRRRSISATGTSAGVRDRSSVMNSL